MDDKQEIKRFLIDRNNLPELFPTQMHSPQFWEQLGRTIATFGFLEEVLGKAIFAFTATRRYNSEEEAYEAYRAWQPKLEKALKDTLKNLAYDYGKAVRENPDSTIENINELVEDLVKAAEFRNILCHGSWWPPDAEGKSLPFFVNNKLEKFETAIDIKYLRQLQAHTVELICSVVDTVTYMGWQFPGGSGPGKVIWQKPKPSKG